MISEKDIGLNIVNLKIEPDDKQNVDKNIFGKSL